MNRAAFRLKRAWGAVLTAGFLSVGAVLPEAVPLRPEGTVLIPGGVYRAPFQRAGRTLEFPVPDFWLAVLPVTNEEFLAFVRAQAGWRRSQADRRFADESYLRHWAGDLDLGEAPARAPVTHVSWFAARAFAQWKGMRLPKLTEWEYAARLTRADGTEDSEQRALLLRWHSSPTPARLADVGSGRTNQFGIHDLHGLVWEWTADFDAPWTPGARVNAADVVCGAGVGDARDPGDFAMFLRFALRGSLQSSYCVPNLGFRCAANAKPVRP